MFNALRRLFFTKFEFGFLKVMSYFCTDKENDNNMHKEIVRKIVLLLAKPEVAWGDFLKEGNPKQQVLNRFCYPLMAVAAVVLLLQEAIFHRHPAFPIHVLIVHSLVYFVSLLSSFYIVQYALNVLMQKRYNLTPTKEQSIIVVGYSFTLVYLLYIVTAIAPSFFFLWVFYFYTTYLLWIAAEEVFDLKVEERGFFVIGMTFFVVLTPVIILGVLRALMPNLQ